MSMFKIILKLCIIFSFISPCLMTGGRKYDVEMEAMKLYGQDFDSVLRQFRRTPEYLKILFDKMNDLKVNVKEMSLQILHYYQLNMTQRIKDMVGANDVDSFRNNALAGPGYLSTRKGRRQATAVTEDPTKIGIKRLDEYKVFYNILSVAERNNFRDLGFEYAGNLIHTIIQNMGPSDSPSKTVQNSDQLTTTKQPHTHEVTSTIDGTTTAPEAETHHTELQTTTETYSFRRRRWGYQPRMLLRTF